MADLEEPLDAYQTAKPKEPTWTVQGGDPLGGSLLRLWAALARMRTGLSASIVHTAVGDALKAAAQNPPESDNEADELLTRATKTEEVSWKMDAYLKGRLGASEEAEISDEKLTAAERLDLHDLRLFAAGRVSNMFSELTEIAERLEAAKFDGTDNLWPIKVKVLIRNLRELHDVIEPASHRERYVRKG